MPQMTITLTAGAIAGLNYKTNRRNENADPDMTPAEFLASVIEARTKEWRDEAVEFERQRIAEAIKTATKQQIIDVLQVFGLQEG